MELAHQRRWASVAGWKRGLDPRFDRRLDQVEVANFLDVLRGKALRHLCQTRPEPLLVGTVMAGAVGDPAGACRELLVSAKIGAGSPLSPDGAASARGAS